MRTAFTVQLDRSRSLRALNFSATVETIKQRGTQHYTPLGDLAAEMGSAYRTAFIRRDADPSVAVELLSQSDLFATEPTGRHIRLDSFQHSENHAIRRWQLLIAGVGTLGETELFGRSILADERHVGKYMSEDAFAVTFKDPECSSASFAAAFLSTRVGVWAVRSAAYGTKTLKLHREMMAELPIPRAEPGHKERVAALVRKSVDERETHLRELRAARRVLEDLPEMREAHEMCAERRARWVPWSSELPTLSAWTYASPGEALQYLQSRWRGRLADVLEESGLYYGGRSVRIACSPPYGVDFVSQRDAFLIRPIPRRVLVPGIPDQLLFVKRGGMVVAGRGTLGEGELFSRPVLVAGRLVECGLTEDLLRVVVKAEHAAVAYAYLSTTVGLRLMRSTAVGTKILNLRADLLRRLPFPDLSKVQKARIAAHVEDAMRAREAAEQAESEAIRIIEEEVLPAWLA